jgi:hypothetical protein
VVVVVVVVGAEDAEAPLRSDEVGVVAGGEVVVVVVLGVEVVVTWAGTGLEDALAPGCSFATTTLMAMVAPVATKAVQRVSSRSKALVRRLVSGVLNDGRALIGRGQVQGSAWVSWKQQCVASRCRSPVGHL